jgi:DMSO reductase anchor subunit
MHPAFSVIFFTTMSGAGYGLWFWLALTLDAGDRHGKATALLALVLGFVLVSIGLLSSTLHLGKPLRAWRAFSQWRSSWLSREGVLAVLCYLPMLCLGVALWQGNDNVIAQISLALLSLATVLCTGMIYASLKPIPAWRHALVLPMYLLFAIFTGGLLLLTIRSLFGGHTSDWAGLGVLVLAVLLWRFKRAYWRDLDHGSDLPVDRASALGLPADREVRAFERPHTEANYLTKEMGFVLARKHSRRLRVLAIFLFALLPALCATLVWLLPNIDALPWLGVAALSALAGTLIERWLFFAEAKHLVMLYY